MFNSPESNTTTNKTPKMTPSKRHINTLTPSAPLCSAQRLSMGDEMEAEVDGLLPATEERETEENDVHAKAKPPPPARVKNLKRDRAWALRSVLKGTQLPASFLTPTRMQSSSFIQNLITPNRGRCDHSGVPLDQPSLWIFRNVPSSPMPTWSHTRMDTDGV